MDDKPKSIRQVRLLTWRDGQKWALKERKNCFWVVDSVFNDTELGWHEHSRSELQGCKLKHSRSGEVIVLYRMPDDGDSLMSGPKAYIFEMTTRWQTFKKFLLFILYWMLTFNERLRYVMGQNRGCHVSEAKTDGWGCTDITYHPGTPNRREFDTFREFMMTAKNQPFIHA